MINSRFLDGMTIEQAKEEVARRLQKERPPSMATTAPASLLKDLPTSRPRGAAR